jgi:hypothetical protein
MVAERGGMPNGPGEAEGNMSCDGRHEIVEVRDRLCPLEDEERGFNSVDEKPVWLECEVRLT